MQRNIASSSQNKNNPNDQTTVATGPKPTLLLMLLTNATFRSVNLLSVGIHVKPLLLLFSLFCLNVDLFGTLLHTMRTKDGNHPNRMHLVSSPGDAASLHLLLPSLGEQIKKVYASAQGLLLPLFHESEFSAEHLYTKLSLQCRMHACIIR